MEQKNLFTAIILSVIVFVVWNYFFMPAQPDVQPVENTQKEVINPTKDTITTFEKKDETIAVQPTEKLKITTVITPLYEISISNYGAVVKQIRLKKFKENNSPESDLKSLIDPGLPVGTYGIEFKNHGMKGMENAVFSVSETDDVVDIQEGSRTLTYTWVSDNGFIVQKTFEFKPDTYLIDYKVTLNNASDQNFNDDLVINLTNRLIEKSNISFEGPSVYLNNKLEEIKPSKIEDSNHFKGDIRWVAIQDRYFLMSLIPDEQSESDVFLSYSKDSEIINAQFLENTGTMVPGSQKVFHYSIYSGPKSLSIMKKIGFKMDKVVDFGMFDIIAKPCLMLMDFIYERIIGNYGVAIIMLTILFKLVLWPLGNKSYKSMNDMKKLQPLVAEIREKHKSDKQKMNEEMMNLYKTYKVNPLSGCLPMVVQMPIFFAFYRMLYSAIELRHAPFVAWITDLSAPDRLLQFNFTIPYFEPPTGIPVLTLLMGASMFLQQKMSPPAGDPTQAKMMMFMPVFMTFIFMNFSSGLVLYWLVNNIVSILQQYYIMKKYA
ncbi:MAG: membrane protein insertase YidC [Proteobacteria bacterium]|nr:membrane protein insertase YidC [Pseudomonadota bacterium]